MDLNLIPLKSNLLQNFRFLEVKTKIIERLQHLHLHDAKYKTDAEFLVLICNLAENLILKKDKISKKTLIIEILQTLFALTPEEEQSISNNIEFIHSNGMIKKVSQYKLWRVGIKELFKKKV